MLEGMRPSIGSVGDAYDNALAETTMGIYKPECVRKDSPFRTGPIATLSDWGSPPIMDIRLARAKLARGCIYVIDTKKVHGRIQD